MVKKLEPSQGADQFAPNSPLTAPDDPFNDADAGLAAISVEDKDAKTTSNSLKRLTIFLMLGAFLSKGLGFIREVWMAQLFGATMIADAFRASLTGAILPFGLLQNESASVAFIPLYRDWRREGVAARFFAALIVGLFTISSAIAIVTGVFSAWWVGAFVGGFSEEARDLTQNFIHIMLFGMPGSVLTAALAAAEIAQGRSRLTTVRASLLNLSMLCGLAVVMITGRLWALPLAFVFTFNALAVYGLVMLTRDGSLSFSKIKPTDIKNTLLAFWRRIRPMLPIPFAEQGMVWLERALSSRLAVGAIAALEYAHTITDCAMLLIAQPIGLALLARASDGNERKQVEQWARLILAFALPASVWLALFSADVATIVFSRGAFNETATHLTAQALRGLACGLWAGMLGWILTRLLNRMGRNARATMIFLLAYLVNTLVILGLYSIPAFQDMGPLLIGLGDSARGLTLLVGAALSLRAFGVCLRVIGAMIPSIVFMIVAGSYVDVHFVNLYVRLVLSGAACLVSIAIGLTILQPEFIWNGYAEFKKRGRVKTK